MLIEPKRIKTECNLTVPHENLKIYLKWIEYIPKCWNIEQLLNKQPKELSNKEIEILKLVKEENKYKKILKQYLTSKENMIPISSEVHNYMDKMQIDKYATIKLTREELDYSQKIISNNLTSGEAELAIVELKQKEDRSLIEEYILFELIKESYRLGIQRLNNEIIESVEENRKKDLLGCEKCINLRNR